jgi:hypothetical protein
MAFNRLIAVLPCYSLEDISKELTDPQIAEFHTAWTVLWHPLVLAESSGIPEWKRSDASSLDIEHALVLVPSASSTPLDAPVMERMIVQNCTIATAHESREVTLQNVLEVITGSHLKEADTPSDQRTPEISTLMELPLGGDNASLVDLHGHPKSRVTVNDFYALGLATLLVQALTRKIHYSSNLDIVLFAEQARNASRAFLDRDASECERWLQSCFDQLSQERDRYFSQSAQLIDLTLLAPTTLQNSLDRQLTTKHPQSILASPVILEKLSRTNPSGLKALVAGIETGQISVAGGFASEPIATSTAVNEALSTTQEASPISFDYGWWSQSSVYRRLHRSRQSYLQFGIKPPEVFAQMEPGISWDIPTFLKNVGYKASLLHAFSDTTYPVPTQSKIAWESSDGKTLDTLASGFVDASLSRSVFSIISDLGKQFDYHQIPTLVFAHWPDRCCDAFQDILAATRRTSALGQWTTLTNYFDSTGTPYSNQKFTASQFAFPIPKNRIGFQQITNRIRAIQQKQLQMESILSTAIVTDLILRGKTDHAGEASQLAIAVEEAAWPPSKSNESDLADILTKDTNQIKATVGMSLAQSIPRASNNSGATNGFLVINPLSGPQRVYLSTLKQPLDSSDSQRIYATHTYQGGTDMVVDIPPMGVLQLTTAEKSVTNASRPKGSITQGPLIGSSSWLLANEFIECQIDPKSGYLRSLMVARKRGGKLSGMPAIAINNPSIAAASEYAIPANVINQYLFNSPLRATIASRGELVHNGKCYGTFQAQYTLWRGARHADISIRYNLDDSLTLSDSDSPWHLSPVWRTAWPSPTTTISTWIHGAKTKAQGPKSNGLQFYAPDLIELDDAEHRLYLTTCGAPIHRRVDSLFLETLIPMTDARTATHSFRLGMDWPRPYQTFLESIEEPWLVPDDQGTFQAGGSLWMVQVNQPNVRLTCRELLRDDTSKPNGIRLMIQETQGKSTPCKISFYRDAQTASKVQIDGSVIESLSIESGEVVLPMAANECSFVDIHF